jgi:hypothetical protein
MNVRYTYDNGALKQLLGLILQDNISSDARAWLSNQGDISKLAVFNAAFVMMPRKTGKGLISATPEQLSRLGVIRQNLSMAGWTTDHLGRVFLLMQADTIDQERYVKIIENLFLVGEMNELVALYSALPLLAYPELWTRRCAEGIRSNIGSVLEAIMYRNPYPAEQLPEEAWNQLVMKAIFTEKQLDLIIGLDRRNNPELARMLLDYARERGAAGRAVAPELWQLAGTFAGPGTIADIKQKYQLN